MRPAWPAALLLASAATPTRTLRRLTDGIAAPVRDKRLELPACRDDVVRVASAPLGRFFARDTGTAGHSPTPAVAATLRCGGAPASAEK